MATSVLSLPFLTATAGEAVPGYGATSEHDLPAIGGEAFVEPIHLLPMVVASSEAASGRIAVSVLEFLPLGGEATAATSPLIFSDLDIPALTGSADALSQRIVESAQALELMAADGQIITGRMAASDLSLPVLSGSAQAVAENPGAVASTQALPLATGDGAAITGRIGSSTQTLAQFIADGIVYAQRVAASQQALPIWEADASAITGRMGTSSLTIPTMGASGSVGAAREAVSVLELPMIVAGQAQAGGNLATSILVLPAWIATGEAVSDLSTTEVLNKTFAVNMDTFAQSRDEGMAFNSYAKLGALFIGANENGLYLLGAYTDDGTAIHALATFPTQDEESAALRRVESMVVGYRADGDLRLTVNTDDGDPSEYIMESVGGPECHPNRVKIGKGMKGRYWNMTLENVDGADFALDKVDIDWWTLSRRTK